MNCFNHSNVSAIALCFGCGKAICRDCLKESETKRLVCSPECSFRVATMDTALDLIAKKSLRSYTLLSRFLLLAALPFAFIGLMGLFFGDAGYSDVFLLSISSVFFLGSYWYYRMSRKNT